MADVVSLFTELAAVPSPSGDERAVADRVIGYLRDLALDVDEDDAGARIESSMGNLYCRIPGNDGGMPLFFCAHLDTVPPAGAIEPVIEDGVVRNAGGTILGADNKSAAAVMLEATRRVVAENRPHAGIELLFTPKEEVGLVGAAAFDHQRLEAKVGYVYDHAAPIGDVILGAPHQRRITIEFHGRAAHSGMYPEEGRSAIVAAARAIADMRLGRLDDVTTANVGVIAGGTAVNVVPARCRIVAEARSLDDERASRAIGTMVDACTWSAGEHECDVDVEVTEMFRGYCLSAKDVPVALARAALERCGLEAREIATGGGSDANALIAAGFDCALLANGTKANHTPAESVAADKIVEMLEVCEAIVQEAARRC
jgi:tripeptide aminopeptidase